MKNFWAQKIFLIFLFWKNFPHYGTQVYLLTRRLDRDWRHTERQDVQHQFQLCPFVLMFPWHGTLHHAWLVAWQTWLPLASLVCVLPSLHWLSPQRVLQWHFIKACFIWLLITKLNHSRFHVFKGCHHAFLDYFAIGKGFNCFCDVTFTTFETFAKDRGWIFGSLEELASTVLEKVALLIIERLFIGDVRKSYFGQLEK